MLNDAQAKKIAKRLYALSLENHAVSPERVQAVLQLASESLSVAKRRRVLPFYEDYIAASLRKGSAILEFAGAVSDAELQHLESIFSKHYGLPIQLERQPNPDLIAGVKARVADDVWESSITHTLKTLEHAI